MAESNQRTARAQKASKAQKAQSGAAKANARQEEEALLRADNFTNAPKVSQPLSVSMPIIRTVGIRGVHLTRLMCQE